MSHVGLLLFRWFSTSVYVYIWMMYPTLHALILRALDGTGTQVVSTHDWLFRTDVCSVMDLQSYVCYHIGRVSEPIKL